MPTTERLTLAEEIERAESRVEGKRIDFESARQELGDAMQELQHLTNRFTANKDIAAKIERLIFGPNDIGFHDVGLSDMEFDDADSTHRHCVVDGVDYDLWPSLSVPPHVACDPERTLRFWVGAIEYTMVRD
jgi:hypothetical protein